MKGLVAKKKVFKRTQRKLSIEFLEQMPKSSKHLQGELKTFFNSVENVWLG